MFAGNSGQRGVLRYNLKPADMMALFVLADHITRIIEISSTMPRTKKTFKVFLIEEVVRCFKVAKAACLFTISINGGVNFIALV